MRGKQVRISEECWEMLYKLAKKNKRSLGVMVEILVEEALDDASLAYQLKKAKEMAE